MMMWFWLNKGYKFFRIENFGCHGAGFCPDGDCVVTRNEFWPEKVTGIGVDFFGCDGSRFGTSFGIQFQNISGSKSDI